MPTYGPDSSGEFLRDTPIRYRDSLPASGDFVCDLVALTLAGSEGLYLWDGSTWVALGGGGGGPATPTSWARLFANMGA